MPFNIEGLIYLIAGSALIWLYMKREKKLLNLRHDAMPELDEENFMEFKTLFHAICQRTLYLAVALLYLAFVTLANRSVQARVFGIILSIALFLYNIPPRNKVMKILTASGIDMEVIKKLGIRL